MSCQMQSQTSRSFEISLSSAILPSMNGFIESTGQGLESIEHKHQRSPLFVFEPRLQLTRSKNLSYYVKGAWFHRRYSIDFTHRSYPLPSIQVQAQIFENNFGFGPGIRKQGNRFFVDFSALLTLTRVNVTDSFRTIQERRVQFTSQEESWQHEWSFTPILFDEGLGRIYFELELGVLACQQRLSIGVKIIHQYSTNAVDKVFSYAYTQEFNGNPSSNLTFSMARGMQFIGLSMGYDLVRINSK